MVIYSIFVDLQPTCNAKPYVLVSLVLVWPLESESTSADFICITSHFRVSLLPAKAGA